MVDLTFVLLLIFIIMTTASVQGVKVNLPQASQAPSLAKPQTKAITISAAGADLTNVNAAKLDGLEGSDYLDLAQVTRSATAAR